MPNPHRVTAQHIHGLAASDRMRGNRTILATTDDGIRYVSADSVFADRSTTRRILLTVEDLREDAGRSGLSMSDYLRVNASRIAREINAELAEDGTT